MAIVANSLPVLSQLKDAMFVISLAGKILAYNDAARHLLNIEDDLVEEPVEKLLSHLKPAEELGLLDIAKAILHMPIPPFDTYLRVGETHLTAVNIETMFINDEKREPLAIILQMRDIDDRKHLEDRRQLETELLQEELESRSADTKSLEAYKHLLISQIPIAIIESDSDNNVVSFNHIARTLLGWTDEHLGKSITAGFNCGKCNNSTRCVESPPGSSVWIGECPLKTANGERRIMFHSCSVLYDENLHKRGTTHVVTDLMDPMAIARVKQQKQLAIDNEEIGSIVAESNQMQGVLEAVSLFAKSSEPILIEGESGVGKDIIAHLVHSQSLRANMPFYAINCATMDPNFIMSELFGHERGAFTGAFSSKIGLMEEANGGTLFVDEVGDMSLRVQAMLLTALETGRFRRMGSTREIAVNVRLIAATNKSLLDEIQSQKFRLDLFHRLNVLNINIPPLRERRDDIIKCANHFIEVHDKNRVDVKKRLTKRAEQKLMQYNWPGNIRELKNVVAQAIVSSAEQKYIDLQHLPSHIALLVSDIELESDEVFKSLTDIESEHILQVLNSMDWNKTHASEVLGVSRTTLISKIKKYNLSPK